MELDILIYVFLFVLKNGRDMLYICIFFVKPNFNSIKRKQNLNISGPV